MEAVGVGAGAHFGKRGRGACLHDARRLPRSHPPVMQQDAEGHVALRVGGVKLTRLAACGRADTEPQECHCGKSTETTNTSLSIQSFSAYSLGITRPTPRRVGRFQSAVRGSAHRCSTSLPGYVYHRLLSTP